LGMGLGPPTHGFCGLGFGLEGSDPFAGFSDL